MLRKASTEFACPVAQIVTASRASSLVPFVAGGTSDAAQPSSFSMFLLKEPHLAWRNRLFTQIVSIAVILLGGLVLTGSQLQIQGFKRILPGLVSMDPNTAAGMLLCGAALSLLSQEAKKAFLFSASALAMAVIALASDFKRILFWRNVRARGLWN